MGSSDMATNKCAFPELREGIIQRGYAKNTQTNKFFFPTHTRVNGKLVKTKLQATLENSKKVQNVYKFDDQVLHAVNEWEETVSHFKDRATKKRLTIKGELNLEYRVAKGGMWYTNLRKNWDNVSIKNCCRYKNLRWEDVKDSTEKLDDYDAWYFKNLNEVPYDCYDPICVSTAFFDYYNPNEYKIIGICHSYDLGISHFHGKELGFRMVVQRIKPSQEWLDLLDPLAD